MGRAIVAAAVKAPPERIPADVHNRIITKTLQRADALEARMVDAIEPILRKAGEEAARRFLANATDHLAAAGLDVSPDATMIALKPRPEEADSIARASGIPASRLHVTLALLGGTDGDLTPVRDALSPVAASYAPLTGTVAGGGFFGQPGDGPAILLPDVRGLVETRVAVTEALVARGIEYARDHGYQAHLTVSYDDGNWADGDWPVGAELHFDAIYIVRGDEVVFELPLVGIPAVTAAATPPDWTAPYPNEVIDVPSLVAQIKAKTDPVREAFLAASMTPALKAAGIAFDVTNPHAARVLAGSAANITHIAETTQLNVMRIIRASYDNGLSIPQTATAIRAGMAEASTARATMIARTELAAAANGGSLAATQTVSDATGASYQKRWLTAPGAPHPRHEEYDGLDGQTQPLDQPFDVGGFPVMYPGDPDGEPGETINCRCTMAYDDGSGEQEADAESPPDFNVGGDATANAVANALPFDTVSVGTGAPVPGDIVQRIKEFKLDAPLDNTIPTTDVGRSVFAEGRDTEALYKIGGQWAPDRAALHDQIVAAHFDGKIAPDAADRTAYFTAGGGASGKSRAIFDVFGEDKPLSDIVDRADTIHIDPDRIKAMLPEYDTLKDANDLYAASGVHEESSEIAKRITAEAYKRGYSVMLDTTGSSSKFLTKIEEAKALGYETKVTMFSIPTNEAIVRSMARGDRSGRYVLISALKEAHKGASSSLGVWKDAKVIDDWRVYDGTEKVPELVAEGGKGTKPVLWNEDTFNQILAKAHEGPLSIPTTPPPPTATTLERLVPGPTAEQVAATTTSRADWLTRAADELGMDAKTYRAKLDAAIAAAVKKAPIHVRVSHSALDSILGDGRFKSQFESRTSGGAFAPGARADAEKTMFGYDTNLDPTLRPIYGYLAGSTPEGAGSVGQYGDVIVNLKDAARDRATFSLADSLGAGGRGDLIPQALDDPKMPSLAMDIDPRFDRDNPLAKADQSLAALSRIYAETQIHGGVTVNDIAEVFIDSQKLAYEETLATENIAAWEAKVATLDEEAAGLTNPADVRVTQAREAERNLAYWREQLAIVENGGESLRTRLDTLGIPWRLMPGFNALDR